MIVALITIAVILILYGRFPNRSMREASRRP